MVSYNKSAKRYKVTFEVETENTMELLRYTIKSKLDSEETQLALREFTITQVPELTQEQKLDLKEQKLKARQEKGVVLWLE